MIVVQINAVYGEKSTGTIVREINDCCAKHGIETYTVYQEAYGDLPNGYRIGNKVSSKIHALLSRISGKQAYFSSFQTWRLLRWLDGIHPDVVHLHNLHNNYIHLNMLLHYLAKHDIATVVTMHDCWYFTGGCTHYSSVGCYRWQKQCGKCPHRYDEFPAYLYDSSSRILKDHIHYLNAIPRLVLVGASEWITSECRKSGIGSKKICFIHNGFDLDIFKPQPSELRGKLGLKGQYIILGPASKWFLPANRTTLDYFVRQMPSDTVLLLFGSIGKCSNLPDNVILYGYTKSREEMAQLYSMADVLVNCSREDTLSSLNLECQACGTPVVTYDATGSKETVDGRCGYAVETGNELALWEAVKKVRRQGKAILSEQCRRWIGEHFDKKVKYGEYIQLYSQFLNTKE